MTAPISVAYKLNDRKAVSETLEGETMIIHLETGSYYSLNPAASVIWELILAGHGTIEILAYAARRYDGFTEDDVRSFIESLVTDGLIVRSEAASPDLPEWDGSRESALAPAFERYDDMQEMLLADPIHDVAPDGWPVLKESR